MGGTLLHDPDRSLRPTGRSTAACRPGSLPPMATPVYLMHTEATQCARLVRYLESSGWYQVVVLPSTMKFEAIESDDAQVLLISQRLLQDLTMKQLDCLTQRLAIVVLARRDAFLELGGRLEFIAGVIVAESGFERSEAVITQAIQGYCLVPRFLTGGNAVDELRLAALAGLRRQDMRVLACLGTGTSNRELARTFAQGEAVVKSQVRNLLRKLRFSNRTEAAVFFSRYRERIEAIAAERASG